MPALTDADRLRALLGDRVLPAGSVADAFFNNDEIADMLTQNNNKLHLAALDGWLIKQAEYASYVDMEESGSRRVMSQLYKQATKQVLYWANLLQIDIKAEMASRRAIGKVVSLRDDCGMGLPISDPGLAYPMYVRYWPSHRMPAVMR